MEHDIYGITRWGDGLVGVLENGNVALNDPLSSESKPVDLVDLVEFSPLQVDVVSPFTTACILQRLMGLV